MDGGGGGGITKIQPFLESHLDRYSRQVRGIIMMK